jgi:hypothetical protein
MIRDARHADVLRMIELGQAMHAESKYSCYDFDRLKLANTISDLIVLDRGIAILAEAQGQIVGAHIGYLASTTSAITSPRTVWRSSSTRSTATAWSAPG